MPTDRDRSTWVLPAAILLLAAGLRLLHLGSEDLWVDEVLQVGYAREMSTGSIRNLSQVLLHFVLRISDSELVLRLPSVFFSVGEIALIYVLALRLFSRRTASLAALFLALSPLHIWYAQEVRWYSQWSFLTTLTYLLMLQLLDDGARLRTWIGYAVTSIINLYTFVLSVLVVLLQAASSALMPQGWPPHRRRILLSLGLVQVAVIAAAGPLVWSMLGGADSPTGTPRPTSWAVLPYTFFAYVAGFSVGPSLTELHDLPSVWTVVRGYPEVLAYFVVFGGLALAGLARLLRDRWPARETVLIWAVGMPLALFLISIVLGGTYNVRYTLVSLPAVFVVLALGAEAVLDARKWRWSGVAAAVCLFSFSLVNYFWDARYDKEHITEALEYVHSTDPTLPVAVSGQLDVVVAYYHAEAGLRPALGCNPESEDRSWAIDSLREEQAFWLLIGRAWLGWEEYCREVLETDFELVPEASFVGVDLFRAVRVRP